MQIKIEENDDGLFLTLIPDNKEDLAQLLRASKNAKAEKPMIYTSFGSTSDLACHISIRKIKKEKQSNTISNNRSLI